MSARPLQPDNGYDSIVDVAFCDRLRFVGMTKRLIRQLHRQLAPIILLPFLVTALTGVAYRLGKRWFGLSRDQVHFLMTIHEGEYLGDFLEPIYVLLNGIGLLFMLATGCAMFVQSVRRAGWLGWRPAATKESTEG